MTENHIFCNKMNYFFDFLATNKCHTKYLKIFKEIQFKNTQASWNTLSDNYLKKKWHKISKNA